MGPLTVRVVIAERLKGRASPVGRRALTVVFRETFVSNAITSGFPFRPCGLRRDERGRVTMSYARYSAQDFAASNNVMTRSPFTGLNSSNQPDGDIVLGRLDRYWDQTEPLDLYSNMPNSVQVNVRLVLQRLGKMTFYAIPRFDTRPIDQS